MRRLCLSIALAALLVSQPAAAQKFAGVSAGVVVPTGDLGRIDNVGYDISGVWQSIPPLRRAGFRLDASYMALTRKATIRDITQSIANLSVGTVVRFPRISVAYGYAIAAAGIYNQSVRPAPVGSTSSTDLGLSLGAGWRFAIGGRKAFAEVRYHKIVSSRGPRFVPVNFGLAF
jgi:hypothetical protein